MLVGGGVCPTIIGSCFITVSGAGIVLELSRHIQTYRSVCLPQYYAAYDEETERIMSFSNKIAAIGVRVRKWVSFHGICINVEPDLSHYTGIVPCGISDHGVTSLINLGRTVTMNDLDEALQRTWCKIFENQDQTL